MDRAAAEQTARFISEKMAGRPDAAQIEWFGGEPLLNTDAIDIICSRLRAEGIRFFSSVTTNALLFGAGLLERAAADWNLLHVQVTLDGIGDRHESVKGFPPGSFDRILDNLRKLMNQGILLTIRVNHTDSGAETELISLLARKWADYKDLFRIDLSPLYQAQGEARCRDMEEILDLRKYLCEAGLTSGEQVFRTAAVTSRCRAADGGYTVAPDGRLYSCVHCMTDNECFGTVWEHQEDHPSRMRFISPELLRQCKQCIYLPFCLGGCRAAELGLARLERCRADSLVFEKMLRMRLACEQISDKTSTVDL